jgi:hypothetical protein
VSAISRRALMPTSDPNERGVPASMAQLAYRHIKHLIVSDKAAAGTAINEQKVPMSSASAAHRCGRPCSAYSTKRTFRSRHVGGSSFFQYRLRICARSTIC